MAASTTHLHVVRTNKLVIFYSREGNTKTIASRIADHVKADVLEIQELALHGGLSFFKLCFRARVKAFTPITTSNKVELANYDTVFIGSPVHVLFDCCFQNQLFLLRQIISPLLVEHGFMITRQNCYQHHEFITSLPRLGVTNLIFFKHTYKTFRDWCFRLIC